MRTRGRTKILLNYFVALVAVVTSCVAQAGPITVSLTGVLGADSPFGSSGSEFSFSFTVDETTAATSTSGTGSSATFNNAVTAVSFLSMNTSLEGVPTNAAPDSNLLSISDGIGQDANEDFIQAFFDVSGQDEFGELFFGFLFLDRHDAGEPAPDSVPSLGLDVFGLLDIADFARDEEGPQIANNQFVFSGAFGGANFSDFTSTITGISVTPALVMAPTPGPGTPGPVQAPEPAVTVLLLMGMCLIFGLRRQKRLPAVV